MYTYICIYIYIYMILLLLWKSSALISTPYGITTSNRLQYNIVKYSLIDIAMS